METFENIIVIFAVVSAIVFLAYIDKRFGLGLNTGLSNDDWFGHSANATNATKASKTELTNKEQEIQKLKERVATLEKIVTDPKEQLRKEIDSL